LSSQLSLFMMTRDSESLKPLSGILGLDKKDLYREAYKKQPFIHRFFLTRLFFLLFNMFRSKPVVTEVASHESASSLSEADSKRNIALATKSEKKKWLKNLRDEIDYAMETIATEKNIEAFQQKLANEWNIKIGAVRQSFKMRVDEEIHRRVKKFIDMLSHIHSPGSQMILQELNAIAESVYELFKSEIHDKHSFIDYAVLDGMQIIKRWIKKSL
ncbi:MAG: hypothetical protein D6767_06065, partial [Candidatus Hydrogenedentota bacterium]